MPRMSVLFALAVVAVIGKGGVFAADDASHLELHDGDRVVFIGNTYAERMRYYGYLETSLAVRFPELGLTFRNLGWSADEITLRPRPKDFGSIHDHLAKQQADVIFVCYGLNESFAGQAGLSEFERNLSEFIETLRDHEYNRETPPRLVLVSPLPQEEIEGLPDPAERNKGIRAYVEAMRRVAERRDVPFVDLFNPLGDYMANEHTPKLTFNGIHMEALGYWLVSQHMLDQLGLLRPPRRVSVDFSSQSGRVEGGGVHDVARADNGGAFSLAFERLPFPPPPDPDAPGAFSPPGMNVTARGLSSGTYALEVNGHVLATADAREWAAGVFIPSAPLADETERIRELTIAKNQLFFDQWRAVNGYYIYGGRKEPFGVVSFPPEMERFDELVAQHDRKIIEMAQPPEPLLFELKLTDQ